MANMTDMTESSKDLKIKVPVLLCSSACSWIFRMEQRTSTCYAVDKTFYLTAARMLGVLVAVIALIHHLISGTDQSHNERAPGC